MIIRPATLADLEEMDALRKTSQEAVGFVPMSRWEEQVTRAPERLLTGWENGDLVAYVFWTPGLPVAAIQHVVVREDARRDERGTLIVEAALEAMAVNPHRYGVTCRCRLDLEATAFWRDLGFEAVRLEDTGGRRGPALRFYKSIRPALLDLGLYLPNRTPVLAQRRGFRSLAVSA
jgi:GNAT superfamily N-acetyltransferase